MALEYTIPWGSWWDLGEFAYQVAEKLFGLPDPLKLFIDQFSGRPKMQATYDIATILQAYTSPVLKILAMGAADCMRQGVPLSSPDAGPIFGPYYKAALDMENAIRWGSQDSSVVTVDNETLTSALNEAGNPGNGTDTLTAIDNAYWDCRDGSADGGQATYTAISALADEKGTATYQLFERGWAQNFRDKFHYYFQQPGSPSPSPLPHQPPPPPKPPPPPPPPTASIQINLDFNQVISGTFTLSCTTQGDFPTAFIEWYIGDVWLWDGNPVDWDTTIVPDGFYTVSVYWIGIHGTIHAQETTAVQVNNGPPGGYSISTDLTEGQTVSGTVEIQTTTQPNDPPSHVLWWLDLEPSSFTHGHIIHWDTTKVSNGTHTLLAKWYSAGWAYRAQVSVTVDIENGGYSITTSLTDGQTVSGTVEIQTTTQPNDPPSHVLWFLDAQGSSFTHGHIIHWDTNQVSDGPHTLTAKWYSASMEYRAQVSVSVSVNNHGGTGTITITNVHTGDTLTGTVHIETQTVPNDPPSHVWWYLDDSDTHFLHGHQIDWDTTTVPDGSHGLVAQWLTPDYVYITETGIDITTQNGTGGGGGNGGGGGGGGGGGNGGGDMTETCCENIVAEVKAVAVAIAQADPPWAAGLAAALAVVSNAIRNSDPPWGVNITDALSNLVEWCSRLWAIWGDQDNPGAALAVMNQIVNELKCICEHMPGSGGSVDLSGVVQELKCICEHMPAAGSVDLSGIIKELKCICDALTEERALIANARMKLFEMVQYLRDNFGYDPGAAQIVL